MSNYTNKLAWETLRRVDSATLGASYVALGTPLLNSSYIIKVVNNSTVTLTISIDGATDVDVVPAGGFFLYDEGKGSNAALLSLPKGTQIYVKSDTGLAGTGSIFLVTQYVKLR